MSYSPPGPLQLPGPPPYGWGPPGPPAPVPAGPRTTYGRALLASLIWAGAFVVIAITVLVVTADGRGLDVPVAAGAATGKGIVVALLAAIPTLLLTRKQSPSFPVVAAVALPAVLLLGLIAAAVPISTGTTATGTTASGLTVGGPTVGDPTATLARTISAPARAAGLVRLSDAQFPPGAAAVVATGKQQLITSGVRNPVIALYAREGSVAVVLVLTAGERVLPDPTPARLHKDLAAEIRGAGQTGSPLILDAGPLGGVVGCAHGVIRSACGWADAWSVGVVITPERDESLQTTLLALRANAEH